jgi:hypothetical protein
MFELSYPSAETSAVSTCLVFGMTEESCLGLELDAGMRIMTRTVVA